jgi:hypothetical protein
MHDAPSPQPASWHTDPFVGPPHLRWWAGDHWTAWVVASPVETPSIAWQPALGELPPPIRWGMPVLRVAVAPPLRIESRPADLSVAEPDSEGAEHAASPDGAARRRPARRWFMVAAAVVIVVCLAAAASAAFLTSSASGRPGVVTPHAVQSLAVPRRFSSGWW